ncbi:MAG: type IX secretion system sortase PorU [Bacteroidales bacterium]|nr:type IX secretion system sortase PorU [Bacteroidales bacterium]
MNRHKIIYTMLLMLTALLAQAQTFADIDWAQFARDSVMPRYSCSVELGEDYALYDYTASIEYPEFVPMSKEEIKRYRLDTLTDSLPSWPEISTAIGISAKKGMLDVSFVPIVCIDGRYTRINSFKLAIGKKVNKSRLNSRMHAPATRSSERYAQSSVLSEGRWVKIRVSENGVHKITYSELSKMGFKNPAKVRLFGYGGHILPETNLSSLPDDLKEVPTHRTGNAMLFYANGTVKWKYNAGTFTHEQNCYSNYGYYFLNESNGAEPATIPVAEPKGTPRYTYTTYPDYALYERDEISLCTFGRTLLDGSDFSSGRNKSYKFTLPGVTSAKATIDVGFGSNATQESTLGVYVNNKNAGNLSIGMVGSVDKGVITSASYANTLLEQETTVTLKHNAPAFAVNGFLDYIRLSFTRELALRGSYTCFRGTTVSGVANFKIATSRPDIRVWRVTTPEEIEEYKGTYTDGIYTVVAPASYREELVAVDINGTFPSVEMAGEVPNQNLHSLGQTDMVIIVPSNGLFAAQAQRIADLHSELDSLTVAVVTAEQVYNEFSSGTPDATAYRRLMKMLYDRAGSADEAPKYLLLLGDAFSDNRLITYKNRRQEDYLLCYSSKNSVSTTKSYVLEDYFGYLDDSEGSNHLTDKADIGVGRIPAQNLAQLTPVVDKIIDYARNKEAGPWQNNIVVLADDGDEKSPNSHMRDAENIAALVSQSYPSFMVRRIYWDDFPVVPLATGNSYPGVTAAIKEQLEEGALIMNYSGHGSANLFSPEMAWKASDMAESVTTRLPVWVTASCDISPFDIGDGSLGEEAILNPAGGAIALLTTTRTVYQSHNALINQAFMRNILGPGSDGKAYTLGEAVRKAKESLILVGSDNTENKLQYILLGDPALRLNVPTCKVVVDKFNGASASQQGSANAGGKLKIEGHIEDADGTLATWFNGIVSPTMFDHEQEVATKDNTGLGAFKYTAPGSKLYSGSDSVSGGRFSITVPMPMDISYSDENGLLNLYAVAHDKRSSAQGRYDNFIVGGTSPDISDDRKGPEIKFYLNTPGFSDGGETNSTPCLFVELRDEDGINTVGSGIGHDVVAIIDNNPAYTFNLNSSFVPSIGDYTSGRITFPLPALPEGEHTLLVRAWDMLNNSSTVTATFNVTGKLAPEFIELKVTPNPVHRGENITFILVHNRPQSEITVKFDLFSFSGEHLWTNSETAVCEANVYARTWNMQCAGGQPLPTGVYIYRAEISSYGATSEAKTGKIIVLNNK